MAAFILCASTASAQVTVELRAVKSTVLQGEPLYVVADVKNVGEYPVGYGNGIGLKLEIPGRYPYEWRKDCRANVVSVGFGWVSHPPMLEPGRTVSFKYLLRGFRLEPGRHSVRVSGTAPVEWKQPYYLVSAPGQPPPPPIPHRPGEPVAGAAVDRVIPIEVLATSPEELQRAGRYL